MIRLTGLILAFITGGCTSTLAMKNNSNNIRIDKGTVYLHISEASMSHPHKIEYRAQGNCVPEVTITPDGTNSVAKHVKDCHGQGRHEGTIFDIWLREGDNHSIILTAGQIFTPGVRQAPTISRIDASVAVGGIHSGGGLTKSSRKHLLGAESETVNTHNSDGMALILKVKMGGIDILDN